MKVTNNRKCIKFIFSLVEVLSSEAYLLWGGRGADLLLQAAPHVYMGKSGMSGMVLKVSSVFIGFWHSNALYSYNHKSTLECFWKYITILNQFKSYLTAYMKFLGRKMLAILYTHLRLKLAREFLFKGTKQFPHSYIIFRFCA